MALSDRERKELADLANRAYGIVEQAIQAYTTTSGMPRRFALGVYRRERRWGELRSG